ncbi:MAG: hypothetical protein HAW60_02385 [Bdellovibrionales bacterium]|nr:hypothetical protein [Bdellovibrionales bacterium]
MHALIFTNNKAFTLIETLIATTILAFLSISSSQSISQALHQKKKIQMRIDNNTKIQQSLNLIQRDINLIYNYSDIPEAVNQLSQFSSWKKQILANRKLKPSEQSNVIRPKIIPLKFLYKFQGSEERINFISASQARLFANQQLSKLQEVSYYVESCNKENKGLCLWRRSSAIIDSNIESGGSAFSILPNVNSLKFRYIGGDEKTPEWKTEWKSSSEVNVLDQLPHAVEIILEIKNKEKILKFNKVALIHHSNIFSPKIKIPKINSTENSTSRK